MKKAIMLLLIGVASIMAEEKIGFVFEAVRHGARAPLIDEPPGYFQVQKGLLTAQGMRQRYLLGKLNRERYINQYQLIDPVFNPGQIFAHSTNVFRVMQSTYSELMGLYPPGNQTFLSEGQLNSLESGKGLPPIKLRNHSQNAESNLGLYIDGYTLIPVVNYQKPNIYDDITYEGCYYSNQCWKYQTKDAHLYNPDTSYMFPILRDTLGKSYGLTPDQISHLDFPKFQTYCDAVTSEDFEGNTRRANFTQMQWYIVRTSQKVLLTKGFNAKARQIYMTRFFRKPLQSLQDKVLTLLNATETKDSLRYLIYSAHDTQLVNVLEFLQPYKYSPTDQTYASTVYFELHYNDSCLATTKNSSCFTVEIYANGLPLRLEDCINANKASGLKSTVCMYDDFMTHMNSKKMQGNFDAMCSDTYVPHPYDSEEDQQFDSNFLN